MLVSRGSRLSTVDTVNDDGEVGSGLAVDHLVGLGHRHIAHLDGGGGSQASLRRKGYVAAMQRHGLEPLVVASEYTDTAGARAVRGLVEAGGTLPTAIVAANDYNAVGAISALEDAGLRVPQDISVDRLRQHVAGRAAARVTDHCGPATARDGPAGRTGPDRPGARADRAVHQLLHPSLVVRATTAPPPR